MMDITDIFLMCYAQFQFKNDPREALTFQVRISNITMRTLLLLYSQAVQAVSDFSHYWAPTDSFFTICLSLKSNYM